MAEFPLVARSLSSRELEVLTLINEGMSASKVADMLFVQTKTVNFHLGNIYRKLGVNKRKDAIAEAKRQGYF